MEKYLDRCVSSIVKQSYTNIEIILIDDGSPDKCPQICDKWSKEDRRIRVIHKENGGLSDARNKGLNSAKGTYICFVDGDDYVSEKYVETLYDLICSYNLEMSAVSFKEVFSMEPEKDEIVSYEKDNIIFEGEDALRQLFSNNTFANYAWNKMYKRELFNDIYFPIGKKMEDLGTTYKLLLKTGKIVYSSKVMYYYYQREDSILHKPNHIFYRDKFELSQERYNLIQAIYPDMKENYLFFLRELLDTYPRLYSSYKDYKWKKAVRVTFSKSRNMLNLKDKIKCFLFIYCNVFYLCINKIKR